MARRMLVIPFQHVIPPNERDENLPEKLRAETSGILNWLLEGALDYMSAGLRLPKAVEFATRAYIGAHDPVGRFIDERLEFTPNGFVTNAELGDEWREWFEAEEGKLDNAPRSVPKTVRALQNELIRRQTTVKRSKARQIRGIQGISMKQNGDTSGDR